MMTISLEEKKIIVDHILEIYSTENMRNTEMGRMVRSSTVNEVYLMAMQVMPDYFDSYAFKKLRFERASINNKNIKDAIVTKEMSLADRALAYVDVKELDILLREGSWLTTLLTAVESLPVCVSLSTARSDRRGFPLIYVNKSFERATGYSRAEIVGRNCRFLQSSETEKDSIERLSNALRDAKPVRVALTNYRKDGTAFKNLLAMKPIFDETGRYRYVIGVQFDVTEDNAGPAKLIVANELLNVLPDVIRSVPN